MNCRGHSQSEKKQDDVGMLKWKYLKNMKTPAKSFKKDNANNISLKIC